MRVTFLVLSSIFFNHVAAYPWLGAKHAEAQVDSINRGLKAIAADEDLVRQIRDLHAQQQREVRDWEALGNQNIARGLVGGLGGAVDGMLNTVVGDVGNIPDITDALAANVQGSKRFPEAAYPFQAPGPTDQRGPCPGLNTLANHGYLPRNGIVTAGQTIKAMAEVFNMGVELASVLLAAAISNSGDIPSLRFSLGGADARTNSLGKLGGSLGTASGSDRSIEGDVSATRCDFYKCAGDNHNMQPELFVQMLNSAKTHGDGQFTPLALAHHFHARYEDSRKTNPNLLFMPPSGLIVIGATYFHAGFFTNGTIGAGGVANVASIASFTGAHFTEDGKVIYVPERIPPQGWFRRAVPMTLAEALAAILYLYRTPYPVEFGGNANGKFFGPGYLPENAQDVNGLGCLLYNSLYANFFSSLNNILFGAEGAVNTLVGLIDPAFTGIGCPQNYPAETQPNKYGGAAAMMDSTSSVPGAQKNQTCSNAQGQKSACVTETNKYDATDVVPNRWRFGSYSNGTGNVRP